MRPFYVLVIFTCFKIFGGLSLCLFLSGLFCGEESQEQIGGAERWVHSTCHPHQCRNAPLLIDRLISSLPSQSLLSFPSSITSCKCVVVFLIYIVALCLHLILFLTFKFKTMFLISIHVPQCVSSSVLQIAAFYSTACILSILLIPSLSYGHWGHYMYIYIYLYMWNWYMNQASLNTARWLCKQLYLFILPPAMRPHYSVLLEQTFQFS